MKVMKLAPVLLLFFSFYSEISRAEAPKEQTSKYSDTLAKWTTYEDVAKWLDSNFEFDTERLATILERVQKDGPKGLLARDPSKSFELKKGYCTDSVRLSIEALNKINPEYKAGYIFIKNKSGPPHHWVTGFTVKGKIMIMDYGTSSQWRIMRGVHGPYDSLKEYFSYLDSLNIKRFSPKTVEWREMPGQHD